MATYGFREGRHKVQCDVCGGIYYDDQFRERWDGILCCYGEGTRKCWTPRNMQDFVRGIDEDRTVDRHRPKNRADVTDYYPNGVSTDDL